MILEFEIIADITSVNKDGSLKLITRNDKIKKLFDLDEIEIEEYIDNKTGKHIKRYTGLTYNGSFFKVNKPYEDIKIIMQNKSIPVLGLAAKSKKYK